MSPSRKASAAWLVCAVIGVSRAFGAELPKWNPQKEGWDAWAEIIFTDDKNVKHDLWCRRRDCFAPGHPATAPLFVFDRVSQTPFEVMDGLWAWSSSHQAWLTTFKTSLSHYSVANGRIVRDDGAFSMDLSRASTPDNKTAAGSQVLVAPPGQMADDAPKPPPSPAPVVGNDDNNTNNNNNAPSGADLDARVEAALQNGYLPIERAIIKKIASDKEKAEIAAGTSTKDWHKASLAAARAAIAPGSELRAYLAGAGIGDKDFSDYVCRGWQPSAAPGDNQALSQLQTAAGNDQTAVAGTDDNARALSDFSTNPALSQFCQDAANASKTQQQQPLPTSGLRTGLVPPTPGGVDPGNRFDPAGGKLTVAAGGSGGGDKSSDKMTGAVFYGYVGALGGVVLGAALGLGPFFLLAAVFAGAAMGVKLALKKDDKPAKK